VTTQWATETKTSALRVTCQADGPRGWNEYALRHPRASLYHDPRWAKLIRRCFSHQTFFLACARESCDALEGVLPLVYFKSRIFGKALVSVPYFNYGGLLADTDTAADNQDPSLFHTYENKAGSPFLEGDRQLLYIPVACLTCRFGAVVWRGGYYGSVIRRADGKFNGVLLHDFTSIFPG
jgi:hypothetical protein